MKRVFDGLFGLVLLAFGAVFIAGGVLRFYQHAKLMTLPNLPPEASGDALLQMLLGLLVVALAYAAATRGWARLSRAVRRNAEPAQPSPAVAPAPPPAARYLPAVLTLTHGGRTVMLPSDGGDAVLGRGRDCRLVIDSKHVSRAHARITWDASGLPRLVPLGQLGTSLRGKNEREYRPCAAEVSLAGQGTVALSADGPDAESRGDVIQFEVSPPEPVAAPAPVAPVAPPALPASQRKPSRLLKAGIWIVAGIVLIVGYETYSDRAVADRRSEMKAVVSEMERSANADRQEYEKDMAAIGWDKLLDPLRLQKDANLSESRTMVRRMHESVARQRAQIDPRLARLRSIIERSDLSESDRREMLSGFDGGLADRKKQANAQWGLEAEALVQFEELVDHLAAKRRAWTIQDAKIVFANQAELDKFRGFLKNIEQISAKQEALRKAAAEHAREALRPAAK